MTHLQGWFLSVPGGRLSLEGLYIPLLEGLGVSERESVFQLATRILYEDAQVIIREGDPGRGLFPPRQRQRLDREADDRGNTRGAGRYGAR